MILYTPFFNTVFHICPLSLDEWLAVLKISLPVVLLDETLKFISRNYVDGNKNFLEGFLTCLVMWIAYAALIFYYPIFNMQLFWTS